MRHDFPIFNKTTLADAISNGFLNMDPSTPSWLEVKESIIPGAGWGVYACRKFFKGDIITTVEVKREEFTYDEMMKLKSKIRSFMSVRGGMWAETLGRDELLALMTVERRLVGCGSLINSARGTQHHSNVDFVPFDRRTWRASVVAKVTIEAGAELLEHYSST